MEPFHSVGMLTHPCFTFHQRMTQCLKEEEQSSRMCFTQIEDWYECKSRKKARAFQNFVGAEISKMEIYSLPTYDYSNDTFKDGPLPKNCNDYFAKRPEDQTYYNWWATWRKKIRELTTKRSEQNKTNEEMKNECNITLLFNTKSLLSFPSLIIHPLSPPLSRKNIN